MPTNTRVALLLAVPSVVAAALMPFVPTGLRVALGSVLVLAAVGGALLLERGPVLATVVGGIGLAFLIEVVLAAFSGQGGSVVAGLSIELLVMGVGLAGAFAAGRAREGQVRQDKDRLLASISHQLRTPLTAVVGFTEILRSEVEDSTPEERRSMLADVSTQAFELSSLIDNLLVASRAELDELSVVAVPVSLRSQLAQELEVWTPDESITRNVGIEGEAPLVVGDPGRIRHILHNLVANAIRHGGARIRIRFDGTAEFGTVTVADDGPGVGSDVVEALFEPYRVPVPSVLPGPLGLGLAVARHLAQLMNGDLTHERVDGWTCFRLWVPVVAGQRP